MGSSLQKLRIAFVGCGGVAEHYLNAYRNLDWARVVKCIDTEPAAAKRAAMTLAAGSGATKPAVVADYEAALAEDIDVVVINTPNHLHREQAIAALDAGKHVLLQKPVAPTVADAEEIANASLRARGLSGLYMSYFDRPLVHDFKEMIDSGWFGRVGHCYARLMHRWGQVWFAESGPGRSSWRGSVAQTGGGCFVQLAVHHIHLMEWMLNQRVTRATTVTKSLECHGIEGEDFASCMLEFESGAMATIDTAWVLHGEQLSISGTDGSAQYVNNRTLILESRSKSFKGRVVDYTAAPHQGFALSGTEQVSEVLPPAMGDYTNPFNQHRVFLEAVRDGASPFVSIPSGVEDLRVVAAVYESARRGCTVEVDRAAKSRR
jgi:predicted dehydrogenase